MSLTIADNLVVTMHYKLTDDNDTVLDSSEGTDPLTYLHGSGSIIPGLERELLGKKVGDKLSVTVDPIDGYGEFRAEQVEIVDKEAFENVENIEVGMTFEAEGEHGQVSHIVITKIEGDKITIDANHPLAGVILKFDVEIVDIREASEAEISHGHVH